jgi:hypothetical protein
MCTFRRALALTVILVALCAPLAAQNNPVPFINNPLVPCAAVPGGPGFTLTVNGAGFAAGAVVNWNNSPRATTFVSPTQVNALIRATDIANATTVFVTVSNPSPGGGISNAIFFEVTTPTTSLTFTSTENDFPIGGSPTIEAPTALTVLDLKNTGIPYLAIASNACIGCVINTASISIAADGSSLAYDVYTGTSPHSIGSGDFNGDGLLDLITVGIGGFSILLNASKTGGDFAQHNDYPLPSGLDTVSSLASGDFNGDGHLDLVFAGTAGVYVLLGNGDGTFGSPAFFNSAASSLNTAVAAGDFNGDGKLDLAVSNFTANTISILIGNGDGTFQLPVEYQVDPLPSVIVAADFNGDGKLDLAVENSRTVSILLGNGNGTFQPKVDYPAGTSLNDMTIGDYNGDGILDLAVADSLCIGSTCPTGGSVNVLLGNGDGTFQSHLDFATGSDPLAIATGEFADGGLTGRSGFAAANYLGNTVSVFTPVSTGGGHPLPTISSMAPLSVQAGSGGFPLTVNGTNFASGSRVLFGTTPELTTLVSSTQLTAQIFAPDVATAESIPVSVMNPAPGGGSSTSIPFNVFLPPPAITSLIPPSVFAGGLPFALIVNGLYFVSGAVVNVNGLPRTAAFVSSTQVTIPIAAGEIATQGTISISVTDPTGGGSAGGTSPPVTLTILPANTQPVIGALHPASATAGGPAFTLQIVGTGFTASSVVTFNSSAVSAAFVNATLLEAAIPASAIAVAGTPFVTVANPGGSLSLVATFTVNEDFILSAPVSSVSLVAGQPARFSLMVVPANTTTTNSVSLTASGLPMGATQTFSPSASIPAGSRATTVTLSISTTARSAIPPIKYPRMPSPYFLSLYLAGLAIVILWLGLRVLSAPKPQFAPTLLLASLLLIAMGLVACGGVVAPTAPSVNLGTGTPAGTYPIVVTAASGNGSLSTTVRLTVM